MLKLAFPYFSILFHTFWMRHHQCVKFVPNFWWNVARGMHQERLPGGLYLGRLVESWDEKYDIWEPFYGILWISNIGTKSYRIKLIKHDKTNKNALSGRKKRAFLQICAEISIDWGSTPAAVSLAVLARSPEIADFSRSGGVTVGCKWQICTIVTLVEWQWLERFRRYEQNWEDIQKMFEES